MFWALAFDDIPTGNSWKSSEIQYLNWNATENELAMTAMLFNAQCSLEVAATSFNIKHKIENQEENGDDWTMNISIARSSKEPGTNANIKYYVSKYSALSVCCECVV